MTKNTKRNKQAMYVSVDQRVAVCAIVQYLLEYGKDIDAGVVSQETLALAFQKYVDLVDAPKKSGDWYEVLP